MTKKILLKGLLGATALTVFTAGNAHAQLTPAGESVENTFTLTYDVGGVGQPPIDTNDPGDPNGPTVFTVDRLIDLTVTSLGDNTVAPGATDEELVFSVTNEGNDTQAYALSIVQESVSPPADTIDTDDPVGATPVLVYYFDVDGDGLFDAALDGPGITYDPANPPELAPDEVIFVVVTQDIPTSATDADRAQVSLVADTLAPVGALNAGFPVTGDDDGNDLTGAAENVLNDGAGTTASDLPNEGDHSATGTYIVAAADITAVKTVDVFSQDGSGCEVAGSTAATGNQYAIPEACMEYTITVENAGSSDATDIVLTDILPPELLFARADFAGFTTGAFDTVTFPSLNQDCATTACTVTLTGATLPGATAPAVTTGTVTIRAFIK